MARQGGISGPSQQNANIWRTATLYFLKFDACSLKVFRNCLKNVFGLAQLFPDSDLDVGSSVEESGDNSIQFDIA